MKTATIAGVIQLLAAGTAVFVQVYQTIHGMSIDPGHTAVAVGLAASGAHHLSKE